MHGLYRAEKWWAYQPDRVLETVEIKVLWKIQCDHVIVARRPDIVIAVTKERIRKKN